MILSLIISLCLTIIIELFTSVIIGIRDKEDIKVVIFANVLTNPVVVFIANCIRVLNNKLMYISVVIIMEIIAILVEYILFKKHLEIKEKSPLHISIFNNIISFSVGIIINQIIF